MNERNEAGLLLFHRLRRVSVAFERSRAEFARRHGLHTTDLRALIALLDAGRAGRRATPGWLGRQLGLNSAGTTTLVDRLERLGHVRRVRDTEDRRKVFVEVTAEAVDLGWSFFGPDIDAAVAAMGSFTDVELAVVARFLDAMLAASEPAGKMTT
jgi:DNA-binding MarR family transcriptional regulator